MRARLPAMLNCNIHGMYLSGASLPVQALAFFAGGMKDPGLLPHAINAASFARAAARRARFDARLSVNCCSRLLQRRRYLQRRHGRMVDCKAQRAAL
jgi:hypothetical protein